MPAWQPSLSTTSPVNQAEQPALSHPSSQLSHRDLVPDTRQGTTHPPRNGATMSQPTTSAPSTAAAPVSAPATAVPGPAGHALVIGEALVDVITADGTTTEVPGGSPANVALGLARLGRDAELVCWIGRDERGQAVRDHLAASGVRLFPGSDGAARTSTAQAVIGADRAATYHFDLDWNPPFPADQAQPSPAGDADTGSPTDGPLLVHTGSIAAILTPGADTVRHTLEHYRDCATICYDPNARPQLMGEPTTARATVEGLVTLSDLVKCSDEDIAWLYGTDVSDDAALESVLRSWLALGAAIVVVTRGKRGALALTSSGLRLEIPADPSVTVADTVGAGDSFMGGLEDGLWSVGLVGAAQREALRAIDAATVEKVVRHAAAIADVTVSRAGANPPTRTEITTDLTA